MSAFETPADRDGLKLIIEDKLAALRASSDPEDDSYHPGSQIYPFAAILVGGILGCPSGEAIAEAMGFDEDFARTVEARLRSSHIWGEDGLSAIAEKQMDGEHSGISFNLHIGVAMGRIMMNETGGFRLTDTGIKDVEHMIAKNK